MTHYVSKVANCAYKPKLIGILGNSFASALESRWASRKEEEEDECVCQDRVMRGRNLCLIFIIQVRFDRWIHQIFWFFPNSKSSPEIHVYFTGSVLIKSVKRLRFIDNIILSFVQGVYYNGERTDQGGTGSDKLWVLWEKRRKSFIPLMLVSQFSKLSSWEGIRFFLLRRGRADFMVAWNISIRDKGGYGKTSYIFQ